MLPSPLWIAQALDSPAVGSSQEENEAGSRNRRAYLAPTPDPTAAARIPAEAPSGPWGRRSMSLGTRRAAAAEESFPCPNKFSHLERKRCPVPFLKNVHFTLVEKCTSTSCRPKRSGHACMHSRTSHLLSPSAIPCASPNAVMVSHWPPRSHALSGPVSNVADLFGTREGRVSDQIRARSPIARRDCSRIHRLVIHYLAIQPMMRFGNDPCPGLVTKKESFTFSARWARMLS
jgi:hypothetical protein